MYLKKALYFFIFSNIHVAIGVCCFSMITLFAYGEVINEVVLFSFFASIFGYNLIRFTNPPKQGGQIYYWYTRNRKILVILTFLSAITAAILSFSLHFKVLLVLVPLGLVTIFYGIKVPWLNKGLRFIPGIKIFAISFVFAGVTVLLPLLQEQYQINAEIGWLVVQRFIFVILITLPFDIRDLNTDGGGLKTIPQQFGIFITKIIGSVLAISILLLEFFFLSNSFNYTIILLIVNTLSLLFLLFASDKQSKYYSAFWVESIPIFWYLLLLIFNL